MNVARTALTRWDIPTDADVELLNLSENATFAVADPNTRTPLILRVGRPEYSTVREVDSELSWIEALAGDRAVLTAPVRRARDGSRVVEISVPELPAARPCVVFGFVPGKAAPEDADLVSYFRVLGELAAKLHGHAQSWQPPQEFQRRRWDYETTIGDRPHWGAWEDGIGVGVSERKLLQRLQRVLEQRLANYGTGPERFGLVHADLRLDNVLFDGPDAYVIDFDDCGWSWFMYDLAACLTFIEDRPDLPALTTSWLAGYRGVAPLEDEAEAIIPTMIMLRRLLVLAWIGSHAETPLAKAEGVAYTEGTCWLAGRYLGGDGLGI
ncbi:MAG TPA: phosphotransferase [Solirubrobacteraceae bacterium]|nr:phosphotransferase [Solirubrobacteraceae bacterium]